jgi:UDP-MurNAc hydroxylase
MRATSLGHAGILIEAQHGSILCDPWFVPAFFGSWFVFPRNDQLSAPLTERVRSAEYLYISHLHADHLDEPWLRANVHKDITVLLPGYPTGELRRTLEAIGFHRFITTVNGIPATLSGDLTVTIHVETSISDGPGGDSAIVVADATGRVLNQNDCRPHDPSVLLADGPVDLQWLQYSGAIWYPMVYEGDPVVKRTQTVAKVDAQFARAIHYVQAIDATVVAPSAGPPCFLDPELGSLNMITGEELSIFPDQREFFRRLEAQGISSAHLTVPGTTFVIEHGRVRVEQPADATTIRRPFDDKAAYLNEYAADWAAWLRAHKQTWHGPTPDLVATLAAWWEPLMGMAPTLCAAIGATAILDVGDLVIALDFPNAAVRLATVDEPHGFRFCIERRLVETIVARRAVDWSNALFLSLRFTAWRQGPFNEFLYNFFKSLSTERMVRTEAEAKAKRTGAADREDITIGDYVVQRFCPHRRADLTRFGRLDGHVLTCSLHGWTFDLANDGVCLTSDDSRIRVRRTPAAQTG